MNVPFVDLASLHEPLAEEIRGVWSQVMDDGAFIGGPHVANFEQSFADYCEVDHAIGVANGTDALRLALTGLGIGHADEVIVPTNTFIATAAAVAAVGATPVFVDVDPDTLLITAQHVSDALTQRTAAVIPVHLYGQPVDMPNLLEIAERAGIAVIEDAAQAHGARCRGRRVGSFGHVACFSFYPSKNLGALGDGGAIVTNDSTLADRIRRLANHGRGSDRYTHDLVGTNSRLDGLQAAMLSVKLPHLDGWNECRRMAAARYRSLLEPLPVRPTRQRSDSESVEHLFVIRVDDRDRVYEELTAAGISARLHYPVPCHLQPAFAGNGTGSLPVAERAARRLISLPMFPNMTDEQLTATVATIDRLVRGSSQDSVA